MEILDRLEREEEDLNVAHAGRAIRTRWAR